MNVAIIGANGQLGGDVATAFVRNGDRVLPLCHQDIEIARFDSVASQMRVLVPDLIVNTAAMHDVEKCEGSPDLAFAVNALGPRNLARVAQEIGAVLMQVSTDYVFDGTKHESYLESDVPRPLNVYGNSKLAGEHFVRGVEKHFVLRTSALYGRRPCRGKGGSNFVNLMLKLGRERGTVRVVSTGRVTPTLTAELADQMVVLSRTAHFGVFHATAEGSCTWYDFAQEIFAACNMQVKVEPAAASDFPGTAVRPDFSVLENYALKARGLAGFRPWQEGLHDYLASFGLTRTQAGHNRVASA